MRHATHEERLNAIVAWSRMPGNPRIGRHYTQSRKGDPDKIKHALAVANAQYRMAAYKDDSSIVSFRRFALSSPNAIGGVFKKVVNG